MPLKGRSLRWGQNENENELQNSRPISKKKAFWAFWDNAFWTTTKCKTGGRFECLKNEDWKRAPPRRLALICAFSQPTARLFTPSSVHFKGLSLPNKSFTLRFCLRLLFVLFWSISWGSVLFGPGERMQSAFVGYVRSDFLQFAMLEGHSSCREYTVYWPRLGDVWFSSICRLV